MYQPRYQPSQGRHIDRLNWCIGRVLVDISTCISVGHRSICRLPLDWYVGQYVGRSWHPASTLTIDCPRNIGRLSVVHRSKTETVSVRCISYTHFPMTLFWSTSKISEGFTFGSCAANSVIIKQHTQVKLCLQATVTNKQVAVKYRPNVSSLSIDMSVNDQTTTLGRHINISVDCRQTYRLMLNRYVGRYVDQYSGRGVHKIHMIQFLYNHSIFFYPISKMFYNFSLKLNMAIADTSFLALWA